MSRKPVPFFGQTKFQIKLFHRREIYTRSICLICVRGVDGKKSSSIKQPREFMRFEEISNRHRRMVVIPKSQDTRDRDNSHAYDDRRCKGSEDRRLRSLNYGPQSVNVLSGRKVHLLGKEIWST
jgi:hypothetical protein